MSRCFLCASVVIALRKGIHHKDTEIAQRFTEKGL